MTQNSFNIFVKCILRLILFVLILGALLSVRADYSNIDKLRLSFMVESDLPGLAQVFYDVGNGINEADSVRVYIPGAGTPKEISFELPSNFINSLRIDPLDKASRITIKEVKILSPLSLETMPIDVGQLSPLSGIEDLKINSVHGVSALTFRTNSTDPQFELKIESPPKNQRGLKIFEKIEYKKYLVYSILIFLIGCLLKIKSFTCLWNFIKSNSTLSIFSISILSVTLSSYPLIFGKSLNYAAGLPMLYEALGWMPGYGFDGFFENFRGSDVAAHSWSFSPMSKVVYQSIFEFFEFPFWNRYVGGGIPLWAQGCYMIGDPLHWVTIFFKASSYAWDVKFYLSKLIFVFGIGLLIRKLINQPFVGLIIILAAPFIGFYTYAFNHPSYFNLTYLPFSLLAWISLSDVTQQVNNKKISYVSRVLLVTWLTWLMLNAGATKESVITTALITGWGLIYNIISLKKIYALHIALIGSFLLAVGLVLVNSPFIVLFLDALNNAATSYDAYGNDPYPASLIIGFFEPIFYQQYLKNYIGPSLNVLFLYFVIGSFNKENFVDVKYKLTLFFSIICIAFAFGFIPNSIVLNLPLINRIHHTGITFSIPLIVFSIVLSAYGLKSIIGDQKQQALIDFVVLIIFLAIANHVLIKISNRNISNTLYFLSLVLFTYLYIKFIRLRLGNFLNINIKIGFTRNLIYLMIALFVLKNGLHILSGTNIDRFVTNPNVRMDIDKVSLAIEAIKNDIKKAGFPSRALGDNLNFIPGVGHYYAVETIGSAEPLKNPYLERYYDLNGIKAEPGWGWFRKYDSNHSSSNNEKFYDSLNVRYLLTSPGTKLAADLGDYKLLINADLDVYIRANAWPRAFYSNHVFKINHENEFIKLLNKSKSPFIAMEGDFEVEDYLNGENIIIGAKNYLLTSNMTCFDIEAPGPGYVVLNETYYPNDYLLIVNGIREIYNKANIWQKSFKVKKEGNYHVCYTYKPSNLNLSLILCLLGFNVLITYIILIIFFEKSHNE